MSATKTKKKASKRVETKAKAPKAARTAEKKPNRVSALNAAAEVLKKSGKAMKCQELIVSMAEQGLWKSPQGRTPASTLYAAIVREITTKGKESRFSKTDRGQFQFHG